MTKRYDLERRPPKPGDAVMRFGDWRKGEPTVLIENRKWLGFGKPKRIVVIVGDDG